jgi:hypothetical protein
MGGPAERRMRAARGSFDDLPWSTFDLASCDPDDAGLLEARAVWTNGVFTEYASAAAFSALTLALLEVQAPVDLCAAAADFAVDELAHVELVSRLVMALGGAAPYIADLSRLAPVLHADTPRLRAAELAIKISCVGEALSLPALARSHRGATHALARTVLDRLRRDEGPHASLGYWFLGWAESWLTPGDRDYLGHVATAALEVYAPVIDAAMADTVEHRIVRRLARHGIHCASGAAAHTARHHFGA